MIHQHAVAQELTIIAMPSETAARVRTTMRDEYGNDLVTQDGEGAPCRVCLRYGKTGERVILFSYKPFAKPGTYQETGPVFIHAHQCEVFDSLGGFPAEFAERALILRPYTADDRIQDSQRITNPGDAPTVAAQFLENPEVAYVHARSATRGCYLFRIERA